MTGPRSRSVVLMLVIALLFGTVVGAGHTAHVAAHDQSVVAVHAEWESLDGTDLDVVSIGGPPVMFTAVNVARSMSGRPVSAPPRSALQIWRT